MVNEVDMSDRDLNIIAAACHSVARAYKSGTGVFDSTPWEVAPAHVKADTVEAVKVVVAGGSEEDLYNRHPRKVRKHDAAATSFSVTKTVEEGRLEKDKHEALAVGDVMPFSDLPAEDLVKLTMFVETVRTMQRAMNPPVLTSSVLAAAKKASKR